MNRCTSANLQAFLLARYKEHFDRLSIDVATVGRDFDFLERGVIDSLGLLDLIGAIETEFGITVDLENLDPEQLTILGPLCDYIEKVAVPRSA